jgi:hypothetical protein
MIYVHYRCEIGDGFGGITTREDTADIDMPPPRSSADFCEMRDAIRDQIYSTVYRVEILAWSVYADSFASPDGEAQQ